MIGGDDRLLRHMINLGYTSDRLPALNDNVAGLLWRRRRVC